MRRKILSLFAGTLLMMLCGCQEMPITPSEPSKPSFVVELSDSDFLEKTRKGVVLLDAYAVWCGPCRMMEPHLEKVAEALQGQVMVARIDAEANREFARSVKIEGYPTLFVFVDGELVVSSPGARTDEGLLELVKKYIGKASTEPEPAPPASQEEQ